MDSNPFEAILETLHLKNDAAIFAAEEESDQLIKDLVPFFGCHVPDLDLKDLELISSCFFYQLSMLMFEQQEKSMYVYRPGILVSMGRRLLRQYSGTRLRIKTPGLLRVLLAGEKESRRIPFSDTERFLAGLEERLIPLWPVEHPNNLAELERRLTQIMLLILNSIRLDSPRVDEVLPPAEYLLLAVDFIRAGAGEFKAQTCFNLARRCRENDISPKLASAFVHSTGREGLRKMKDLFEAGLLDRRIIGQLNAYPEIVVLPPAEDLTLWLGEWLDTESEQEQDLRTFILNKLADEYEEMALEPGESGSPEPKPAPAPKAPPVVEKIDLSPSADDQPVAVPSPAEAVQAEAVIESVTDLGPESPSQAEPDAAADTPAVDPEAVSEDTLRKWFKPFMEKAPKPRKHYRKKKIEAKTADAGEETPDLTLHRRLRVNDLVEDRDLRESVQIILVYGIARLTTARSPMLRGAQTNMHVLWSRCRGKYSCSHGEADRLFKQALKWLLRNGVLAYGRDRERVVFDSGKITDDGRTLTNRLRRLEQEFRNQSN